MNDVGINIKVTENMSSVASGMVNSMKTISSAAEEMKESLSPAELDAQWKEFAERVNKSYDNQHRDRNRKQHQDQQQRANETSSQRVSSGIKQTGGAVSQLGEGDALGAAAGLGEKASAATSAVPILGSVIAGMTALLVVTNALSSLYEKHSDAIIDTAAQFGKLNGRIAESSTLLPDMMKQIADAGADFGYSLEKSSETFNKLGTFMSYEDAQGEARNIFKYGRGKGMSLDLLTQYSGMGSRFGMGGNQIGMGISAAMAGGMIPGRYDEFFRGTLDIFEEGLSRGIAKGFTDINVTQAWLGQLGEVFKGQTGLQMYKKMEGAIVGATGLGTESDAMMYRAAQRLVEKQTGGKFSYVDVMKKLEQGLSPELFNEFRQMVMGPGGMAANKTDAIELFRQAFHVNYSTAEALTDEKIGNKDALEKIRMDAKRNAEVADLSQTPEIKLAHAQLDIITEIRDMVRKSGVLDLKTSLTSGVRDILPAVRDASKFVGSQPWDRQLDFMIRGRGGEPGNYTPEAEFGRMLKNPLGMLDQATIDKITGILGNLGPEELTSLGKMNKAEQWTKMGGMFNDKLNNILSDLQRSVAELRTTIKEDKTTTFRIPTTTPPTRR